MKILYQFAWPAQNLRLKFNLNESSKKYDNLEKEKVEIQTCFSKDFNYLYKYFGLGPKYIYYLYNIPFR